jgi:hypothetical protein
MLGKVAVEGLRLTNADLEPCSYQILTFMGKLERIKGITKHGVAIQVNLIRLANYTMVYAKAMAMHATSYDLLVVGTILYPLGVTLDFWEEIAYYRLGWQIGNNHKVFLPIIFIGGHARKSNNLMMLIGFSGLPHGFDLLEGNVHDMDSPPIHELKMLGA